MNTPDIHQIKREAKGMKRRDASMTYMQHLDRAAISLYGVRHFHEAQILAKRDVPAEQVVTHAEHYLRCMQECYLDF